MCEGVYRQLAQSAARSFAWGSGSGGDAKEALGTHRHCVNRREPDIQTCVALCESEPILARA
eukprot:9311210-Pyramimonas_sp.AAC.1